METIINLKEEFYASILKDYHTICKAYRKTTTEVDVYIHQYMKCHRITFLEAFEELLGISEDVNCDRHLKKTIINLKLW